MYPRDLPMLAPATPMLLASPMLAHSPVNPGMSLPQWAVILWAYRLHTALIAAIVVLAAGTACVLWPRTYVATSTLMVDYEVNDPLGGREFPIGLLGSYISTQLELVRSPEVLLPAIGRLKLARKKAYSAGYKGDGSTLDEWVETQVRKNLLVEQGQYGSYLIYVTYSAHDAGEAADVANTIASIYVEQNLQRTTAPATERAKRYKEQLAELQQKVAQAQDQVTIQTLKGKLVQQLQQMAELRATFGPRHPQALELQAQIDATRASLARELRIGSGSDAAREDASRWLGEQPQREVDEQRAQVGADTAKYQLELDAAQAVYKRALDGYDQVIQASTGRYTNIEVTSRARPPLKPSKPKVMLAMLLAVFAGLFLGVTGPLCYELLHRRVRCRDDLERDHGIPVLVEFAPITYRRSLA